MQEVIVLQRAGGNKLLNFEKFNCPVKTPTHYFLLQNLFFPRDLLKIARPACDYK